MALYHSPGTAITYGKTHDLSPASVGVRKAPKHPIYRRTDRDIAAHNAIFPLFTRAGVFQERMLSPRIIHFGPHEMFWECNQQACACDQHRDDNSDPDLLDNEALSTKRTLGEKMGKSEVEPLAPLWRNLVEEYSQLKLTKSFDKLPAIEGLVTMFRDRQRGKYAAGIWTGEKMDLLWVARTEPEFRKPDKPITTYPSASYRTKDWRAPSWSWASVDADIMWPLREDPWGYKNFVFEAEFFTGRARRPAQERAPRRRARRPVCGSDPQVYGKGRAGGAVCRHPYQGTRDAVAPQDEGGRGDLERAAEAGGKRA